MREWRIAVTGGESSDARVSEVFAHLQSPNGIHIIWCSTDGVAVDIPEIRAEGYHVVEYAPKANTRIGRALCHTQMVNDGFDILVAFKGYDEDLVKRATAAGRQILWAEEEP